MFSVLAQAQSDGFRNTIDTLARTPISIIVYIVAACTILRLALFTYTKSVEAHQRTLGYQAARFANEAFDAVVYALIFVFLLIRPFGVQAFTIPTGSMVPTLKINDYIVANKAVYRYSEPKVDDIVVFKPPPEALVPGQEGKDVDYIKRVQGVPGDVVEIKDNVLYRNGKKIDQPYVRFHDNMAMHMGEFKVIPPEDAPKQDFKLVKYKGDVLWPLTIEGASVNASSNTAEKFRILDPIEMNRVRELPAQPVPPGYILVMGDNRNGSFDSRGWGLVARWRVIGRSEFIWFPLGRMSRTR